ncbi:MAG TPA: Gfo/Idh/MocA family oxidoreductase [Tepidisphaeraceae bacterium]|nr:Gfo/Idh/MocA family oxidoreductase [Tepidisphaeraceae bacterium]
MKIGIVDLDTSHPANWIPIERELGHEIVGLYDGGTVHPPGYADKFAAEHKVPRVFKTIEEMVSQVDCGIIHGCDWDTHIAKAKPFIDAEKAVLIDKPLAGNIGDLEQIRAWAKGRARITGGSSLRFCIETQQWLAKDPAERGTPDTVICGCGVDEFNYGIHAYSMLSGAIGIGAKSVRHLGKGVQRRLQVKYGDGREGILVIGQTAAWLPFHATIVTERSATQYIADAGKLYRALLEATLPYLAGETDRPPLDPDALIEPELCALAAQRCSPSSCAAGTWWRWSFRSC